MNVMISLAGPQRSYKGLHNSLFKFAQLISLSQNFPYNTKANTTKYKSRNIFNVFFIRTEEL